MKKMVTHRLTILRHLTGIRCMRDETQSCAGACTHTCIHMSLREIERESSRTIVADALTAAEGGDGRDTRP